ncbi:MAG: acetylxylan esterase [Chloroflexi bacterium]|nr:acetylxylan esterase [Chloroflexota bacterium]
MSDATPRQPGSAPRPADFDAYWQTVDDDLARLPAALDLEPLPLRSNEHCTVYTVKITSVGPYRIFGYYSVPKGTGPFPGLLLTPRYGSVNHVPDYNDRRRYAVLQIMHRGQRLADEPFAAAYPGVLTHGISDPSSYVYRGIVADCLRAAELLTARPEVDQTRVAVSGDDLAILTAARRPRFTAALVNGYSLYRLAEARQRTDAYPVEEVNDALRAHPDAAEAVARTLAYFSAEYHAPSVTARTLLAVGDGALGNADWLAPLTDALGGPVEHYPLTHEGRIDADALDAWLARQLGTEPMSAFRWVLV